MKRRPTKRAFVIAGIGSLLVVAGITAQAGWLFVLAAGVFGLIAGSFLVRHRLHGVAIQRSVPRRVRVGDLVPVGLRVENTATGRVPLSTLEDRFPAFDPVRVGIEGLAGGTVAEIEVRRTAIARGRFTEGEARSSSGAPFGLTRSMRKMSLSSDLLVVPRWVELRSFPLLESSSSLSDVSQESPRAGMGAEFFGVREFRPGDPMRAVHWRSTARAGTLVVREFEQEIANRTVLVVAGPDHGEGPTSSFETLVSATASIGLFALSIGHRVDLVCSADGPDHLLDVSRDSLLDRLATIEAGDASLEPLIQKGLDAVGSGGTFVVLTSTGGAAERSLPAGIQRVHRAGGRCAVVLARASSWDDPSDHPVVDTAIELGADAGVPLRVLEKDRELGSCLAG